MSEPLISSPFSVPLPLPYWLLRLVAISFSSVAAPSAVGRSSRSSGEWWMREVRQAVWQHRRWARNEGSWSVSLASLARYLVVPDSLP